MRHRALALLLGWAFAALACSQLPDSAAPQGRLVDPASLDSGDVIRYRTLTRDDFKGTKAPPEFASVADSVGAATCGHMITLPGTELVITGREGADGSRRYWGAAKNLGFRALMDRKCSWWNEKNASAQPAYVLEHEQIHFAIFELGARKLNASAARIMKEMASEGSTQEEVQAHAGEVHAAAMQRALTEILARSRDFDEDTSLGYKPERQKRWLKEVSAELAATAAWAR